MLNMNSKMVANKYAFYFDNINLYNAMLTVLTCD